MPLSPCIAAALLCCLLQVVQSANNTCSLPACFTTRHFAACCFWNEGTAGPLYNTFHESPSPGNLAPLLWLLPDELQQQLPLHIRGENGTAENIAAYFKPATVTQIVPPRSTAAPLSDADVAGATPLQNIGRDTWEILNCYDHGVFGANCPRKPSGFTNHTAEEFATATPDGVTSSSTLDGWQRRVWPGFQMLVQNGVGEELCSLQWDFAWSHHGAYQSRGLYVTHATTLPSYSDAFFMIRTQGTTAASEPINIGTSEDPKAQLTLATTIHCTGWVPYTSVDVVRQVTINVRGDGTADCVGGCHNRTYQIK